MPEASVEDNFQLRCVCCGNNQWAITCRLPGFLFGRPSQILKCQNCGCGATWPPPELSTDHYLENEFYSDLFTQNKERYSAFAKYLLGSIDGLVALEGKSLIDIGCGGGFLVRVAAEAGMIAEGIEANASMVSWARENGLNVSQGDVLQLQESGRHFDVVVLSAILEHLENPGDLLRQCKGILREGGMVVISQASFDGLLPRIFPWGWYGWQPKEHYWHFTPNCFSELAQRAGYRPIKVERGSLHHQWFFSGGLKVVIGRNIATLLAKVGGLIGRGDSFNMVLKEF